MFDHHIVNYRITTTPKTAAAIDAAELSHLMCNAQLTNDHDLRAQIITYRIANSI